MDLSERNLLWLWWATKAASIGAYVFLWLELFNGLPEEVENIWRYFNKTPSTSLKRVVIYLYAFSRYFPLVSQAMIIAMSHMVHRSPIDARPGLCITLFTLQSATAQALLTCLEIILAIRVHALYNCSYRTGQFLVALLSVGTMLEVGGSIWAMGGLEAGEKGTICVPKPCPVYKMAVVMAGCALIQTVLLGMTLTKIIMNKQVSGWLRAPIVTLMLRDGIATFVMLALILTGISLGEVLRSQGLLTWDITVVWYISFLSVILTSLQGCRLILSMRRLAVTHPRNRGRTDSIDSTTFDNGQFTTTLDAPDLDDIELESYVDSDCGDSAVL